MIFMELRGCFLEEKGQNLRNFGGFREKKAKFTEFRGLSYLA
jgi:outer membrane protease